MVNTMVIEIKELDTIEGIQILGVEEGHCIGLKKNGRRSIKED
jgi:hypothetical protein